MGAESYYNPMRMAAFKPQPLPTPAELGSRWRRRYGVALAVTGWALRATYRAEGAVARVRAVADRADLACANRVWKEPR